MFEFLFKYPSSVFNRGTFVFLAGWPVWVLILGVLAAAAVLGWLVLKNSNGSSRVKGVRGAMVWLLQATLATLVLLLIWHPALSVATLKPQQNIVAVVVDDSSSMAIQDAPGGSTRSAQAVRVLNSGLVKELQKRFQVRFYRLSDQLQRIDKLEQLNAGGQSTHIGDSLKEVLADAQSLPIGAVVLASDGSDNTGGIDLETISEIRRQRIPIHTIGFGREKMDRDVEITDVQLPARAIPDSRLGALVSFHQHGYSGTKVKLTVREGGKVLAARDITFKGDGVEQTESILFNAGPAGVKNIEAMIEPLPAEENTQNNRVTRIVNVDRRTPKILYLEGEPRWEFKFLRRAVEDDHDINLITILRTTQNKNYVQDPSGSAPKSVKDGIFPTTGEDLFDFDGLIIGSLDAPYLTPIQQTLIREFVDRRGGGVLFLGGRDALSDGGWQKSFLHELLPVTLPDRKNTFVRDPANAELTAAGRDSLIVRLEEDPDKNVARWKKMPYLMNFQDVGQPKPGAVVLLDAIPQRGGRLPLLVMQNYGRGRTAVFATGGSWRWQMLQPVSDMTHEMFYQQLLRWLVNETPRRLVASTPRPLLEDEAHVKLRVDVRDKLYQPAGDATVEAHVLGPEGIAESIAMQPEPLEQGVFTADWTTPKPGSYLVEVLAKRGNDELGRDILTFRREDGVAEHFHAEQNRALLEKLSSETGGVYYTADAAQKLATQINYSEAGITMRETRDLWDMPIIFLAMLGLRAGEWLLRRKWGVI